MNFVKKEFSIKAVKITEELISALWKESYSIWDELLASKKEELIDKIKKHNSEIKKHSYSYTLFNGFESTKPLPKSEIDAYVENNLIDYTISKLSYPSRKPEIKYTNSNNEYTFDSDNELVSFIKNDDERVLRIEIIVYGTDNRSIQIVFRDTFFEGSTITVSGPDESWAVATIERLKRLLSTNKLESIIYNNNAVLLINIFLSLLIIYSSVSLIGTVLNKINMYIDLNIMPLIYIVLFVFYLSFAITIWGKIFRKLIVTSLRRNKHKALAYVAGSILLAIAANTIYDLIKQILS